MEIPISDKRSFPLAFANLTEFFKKAGGYYAMGNEELAGTLLRWDLLEEDNRTEAETAWNFLRWSLTASFLQLMNAIQWFLSALMLERSSYLPAQTMQQNYYSIFFAYGSFLALHGKGYFTVKIEPRGSDDPRMYRRELWLDEGPPPLVDLKEKGRGGEHEVRANWYYEVFKAWEQKDDYPGILMFEQDRKFHTGFRNMFTYALSEMAEELHHDAHEDAVSNEVLLRIWNREPEAIDIYPDEYWVLEHLRAPLEFHAKLIDDFGDEAPFTSVQEYLVSSLRSRHEDNGVADLLEEILKPIIARI